MEAKDVNRTRVNTMVYTIEANRWIFRGVIFFVGMECLFILLDLLFTHFRWISVIELSKIFDMTRERAVGTWLSTVMAFLVGLTLLIIFAGLRADNGPKREAVGWLILSLFFLYMSADDCAYIHERSGDFIKRMVSSEAFPFGLSGMVRKFPSYYWHLIMGPFFAAIGLFMIWFLWHRFGTGRLRKYLIISLSGLAGAMLLDLAEGMDRVVKKLEIVSGMSEHSVVHLLRLTEESMELFSVTILFFAFLRYLAATLKGKKIVISE